MPGDLGQVGVVDACEKLRPTGSEAERARQDSNL
jgi:hypothetical protein